MQVKMLRVPQEVKPSLLIRLQDQTNILRDMKFDTLVLVVVTITSFCLYLFVSLPCVAMQWPHLLLSQVFTFKCFFFFFWYHTFANLFDLLLKSEKSEPQADFFFFSHIVLKLRGE